MHLFNEKSQRQDTSFILNRKEWRVRGREGEREKERERCGVMVKMGCGVGHKLVLWSSIYQGLELDFIKMSIKLIPRIWMENFSICCYFSSHRQTVNIPQ
jgi:hypothetical protein